MALLNHAKRELSAKIVYYGPGLSGKTTNLEWIHRKLAPDKRGKLISLETKTDRTLFFDFLPVQIGEISGFRTRFNVYTVPGQIFYNETRRMVLKGVDGIVFVADSQKEMANENLENLKNLAENLRSIGKELSKIPLVIQFNKRDLPNILSVQEMNRLLNAPGLPFFEAVAVKGEGVLTTLTRITRVVADHLKETLFAAAPEPEPPPARRSAAPAPAAAQGREPPGAPSGSPLRSSDAEGPAFLAGQPKSTPKPSAPELHVFSQEKEITPSFSDTFSEQVPDKTGRLGHAAVAAPATQPVQKEEIPSLGDVGEPLESRPFEDTVPTLASVEPSRPVEAAHPKHTVVPLERPSPADRVIPLERPGPMERTLEREVPKPAPQETSSKSYWVDPSLVSVSAEQVSAPETQKGVALRFGEPERESGDQVRIPVALRLRTTNEIISFQMVIRIEQESEPSS